MKNIYCEWMIPPGSTWEAWIPTWWTMLPLQQQTSIQRHHCSRNNGAAKERNCRGRKLSEEHWGSRADLVGMRLSWAPAGGLDLELACLSGHGMSWGNRRTGLQRIKAKPLKNSGLRASRCQHGEGWVPWNRISNHLSVWSPTSLNQWLECSILLQFNLQIYNNDVYLAHFQVLSTLVFYIIISYKASVQVFSCY